MKHAFKYLLLLTFFGSFSVLAMDTPLPTEKSLLLNSDNSNKRLRTQKRLVAYKEFIFAKLATTMEAPVDEFFLVYLIGKEFCTGEYGSTLEEFLYVLVRDVPINRNIKAIKEQRSEIILSKKDLQLPLLQLLEKTKDANKDIAVEAYYELIDQTLLDAQQPKKLRRDCSIQ
jgi:hypothetical protein